MAKKQLQLFEINKIIMLNFSFIQRVYFLNLFSAIFVYVYHDTSYRNCSCIITLNREKCQIIKSPCWRFQARHRLWNSKRQEIPLSNKGSINAVTKLAVWLQVTVKKNRIDDQKSSSFEISNLPKITVIFFCTYKDFLSQIVFFLSPNLD